MNTQQSIEARFRIDREGFSLDVNICVPATGVTAFLGPSGCGKTSLLRAIAGLDQFDDAYLKVADTVWQDKSRKLAPHKRPLGFVFQDACLFAHLSVQGNLEYGMRRIPVDQRHMTLEQATEWLGIGDLLSRKPMTLSGGERQRVAIARALLVSPRLLLMDEPLSALDSKRKQEIFPYLDKLREGLDVPVLYVSHSADEVARISDYLVIMDAGKIVASGPVETMLTRLDLTISRGPDAEALIDAVVVEHDQDFDLTILEFAGGRFTVPRKPVSIGSRVRIRVAARDVSLTLGQQTNTSILNIFPATIDSLSNELSAQVTVRLKIGATYLLARVTRKSAVLLDLQPGKSVYAQAKSVAVLI